MRVVLYGYRIIPPEILVTHKSILLFVVKHKSFVKELQIGYLKNLQAADLQRRRERFKDTNEMFLAYEVKKVSGTSTAMLTQPLLLDDELKNDVHNLDTKKKGIIRNDDFDIDNDDYYVRGDLLGFVEITQRPYGLGSSSALESSSSSEKEIVTTEEYSTSLSGAGIINDRPMRPVLTNLAVLKGARRSGIGSKLVDACEKHVRKDWNMNEIILEVEDYNTKGLEFYQKAGFDVLFSDPASRRYDIDSGLWLKKVRCRREIMRKVYNNRQLNLMESADNILRIMRETLENL
jgi:ribosomal protein S18 acetylase RimI-like enzyme